MSTVLEGQGQLLVGVSLSELFLASGSYFRSNNCYNSPYFHWRLHKLMVVIHTPRYPPCRAFFPACGGFSFFFSFHLTSQSAYRYDKQGWTFFLLKGNSMNGDKILMKNCITDIMSIKFNQILNFPQTSLLSPPVSARKPPLPPPNS